MIIYICEVCGKEVESQHELIGHLIESKDSIELSCGKNINKGCGTVYVCNECQEKISNFIISIIKK